MESKSGTRSCEQKQGDYRVRTEHTSVYRKAKGRFCQMFSGSVIIDFFFSSSCLFKFYTRTLMSSWWLLITRNTSPTPPPNKPCSFHSRLCISMINVSMHSHIGGGECITQNQNFVKLPDCEKARYFPLTKRPWAKGGDEHQTSTLSWHPSC